MRNQNSRTPEDDVTGESLPVPASPDWHLLSCPPAHPEGDVQQTPFTSDGLSLTALARSVAAPEQLLRSLLTYSSAPVFVLDRDETYRLVNRAWEEVTGHSREEALGRKIGDLWDQESARSARQLHRLVLATTLPQIEEHKVDLPQGPRCYQIVRFPLFDEQGSVHAVVGIAYDSTPQKQLEAELRQSQQRLQAIFQGVFQFIGLMTPDGTLLEANRSALAFGSLSAADVVGKKLWHTPWCSYAPEVQERFRQATQQAAAGELVRFDIQISTGAGRLLWIDFSLSPFRDEAGHILYLVPDGRPIEDRIQAEERFRTLFESAPVANLLFTPEDDRIVDANARASAKLGYTHEELVGLRLFDIDAYFTPDNILPFKAAVLRGERVQVETVLRTKGGEERDALVATQAVYVDGRNLFCASLLDITERKQAERRQAFRLALTEQLRDLSDPLLQMERATALLGQNLGVAQVGFGELDRREQHLTVHRNWNDGRTPSIVGTWRTDDFGPQCTSQLRRGKTIVISDILEDSRTLAPEVVAAYGRIHTRAMLQVPLLRKNRLVALLLILHPEPRPWSLTEVALVEETCGRLWDSVEHARAEQALQRSNEDLERFALMASHDLQEPLRMITAYSQLLARRYRGLLDREADEFIGTVLEAAQHMQRLIQDLLAYARSTSGEPPAETADGNAALALALAALRQHLEETQAIVDTDPLPNVSMREPLLAQVLQNLIGNALKYRRPDVTPEVHISATRIGENWVFSVEDNGQGIAAKDQKDIFELFTRLHDQTVSGTGIGLATVRRVVHKHGGRVWVESEPGVGSTFSFSLPA